MSKVRSCFARGRSLGFAAITGTFLLAAASPASAVINAYLFVDGIDGPSTTRLHAIDLESFSVGVSAATSTTLRTGAATASKPVCSELAVMKLLDAASIPLVAAALTSRNIATVKVIYSKPVLDKSVDFFTLTLGNVRVTSVQESGSSENPVESVSFVAQTYTFSFRPQKTDGTLADAIETTGTCG